jgi:hypothetical protein
MGIERFLFHDVTTVDVLNPWQTKRESHFGDIWLRAVTPAAMIESLAAGSIVVFCHASNQLRPHKPTDKLKS